MREIRRLVDEARAHATEAEPPQAKFPPGEGPRFRGTVTIDPAFADRAAGATLWVIVRSQAGMGMPIAVQQFTNPSFPLSFDVGAEHAPLQSDDTYEILAGELKVVVRLSRSGGPTAGPGDIVADERLMRGDDPAAEIVLDAEWRP